MTNKWYAGIGSRKTPKDILVLMQEFGYQLAKRQWGLRSGAAPGADSAFELGAVDAIGETEIFLPWKNFAGHTSTLINALPEAYDIAATIHPVWNWLKPSAKGLVARNMHQILGPDLKTPVEMVICWTPDGCESREQYSIKTGGTGTAIVLASDRGIPIFNLQRKKRIAEIRELLEL